MIIVQTYNYELLVAYVMFCFCIFLFVELGNDLKWNESDDEKYEWTIPLIYLVYWWSLSFATVVNQSSQSHVNLLNP